MIGLSVRRMVALALILPLTMVIISACSSPSRTTAGFCKVYHQQEAQYLGKYSTPAGNTLADLVQLVSAISDWVPIFDKLDQASPPSIEPDVKNVLDSLKQQEQAVGQEASDPLGGLASGLMAGLMSTASWNNVDSFISEHCNTQRSS